MIESEKANYPIARMCRLLNVDRRRYYEWLARRDAGPTPSQQRLAELTARIRATMRLLMAPTGRRGSFATCVRPASRCRPRRSPSACGKHR